MRYTQPLSASQSKKWQRLTTELDVEIYVVSFSPNLRPHRFDEHAHFYLWPALPLAPLRYLTAYLVAPPLVLWLALTRGIDVFVTHDPYIGVVGALVKNSLRLFGRQVGLAVETRGDLEAGLFMQRDLRFKSLWRFFMQRTAGYALHHADVLRAVSDSSRQQVQAIAPQKPVHQFMSWTDSAAFVNVIPEQPVSQRCDLVYAGVLVPRKGVHILLDALDHIAAEQPQTHLFIIGQPSNPDYAAELHEQVTKLQLTSRVTFIDHLPQAELAAYMARARAVILPTYSEGLPKVIIEAMLCGTPVIASAVDGIPEIVQDGVQGYLVPPGDVTALVAALRHLFANAQLDDVGAAAKTFATQFYSADAYIKAYGQLFLAAKAK